jgi:MarR family transcriptional regulator, organic hydroperoxide resistance regulator
VSKDLLVSVAEDLLSIPPLIFRTTRKNFTEELIPNLDVNITPLQFEILFLLQKEKVLCVSEIGERLDIAKAQMTQLINKLAGLSLIERRANESDRRTVNIALSGQGSILIRDFERQARKAVLKTLSSLSEVELEQLSSSLKNLQDILLSTQ